MQDSSRNGCAPPPTASSGTANTYANPNSAPPPNQRRTFLRRLLLWVIVLLLILSTIDFIGWIVLRPQYPDFTVQSLSLSNFNAPDQRINATWDAEFLVWNPNEKLSLSYRELVSWVSHRDYILSETRMRPFVQGTRNASRVEASYSAVESFVKGKVVEEMNGEKRLGEMKFNLKVRAHVAFPFGGIFRYGGWAGHLSFLRVSCSDVAVAGPSGKMTGGPKKCLVLG